LLIIGREAIITWVTCVYVRSPLRNRNSERCEVLIASQLCYQI
jgi:hypothetical protein